MKIFVKIAAASLLLGAPVFARSYSDHVIYKDAGAASRTVSVRERAAAQATKARLEALGMMVD